MIGRVVSSAWHGLTRGEIIQREPHLAAMCDVLVRDDSGRLCWYASHALTPIDGLGPLPSRREAQETRRLEMVAQLETIRAQHVAACAPGGERWPGCEFAKVIIGKAIDGALASTRSRTP